MRRGRSRCERCMARLQCPATLRFVARRRLRVDVARCELCLARFGAERLLDWSLADACASMSLVVSVVWHVSVPSDSEFSRLPTLVRRGRSL